MKLLLIDDDEELCAELREILEAEGFKVDTAFDGRKGLQLLQARLYHLIVLDLKLPGINGYGVLKDIRKNAQPVKVLVLSGKPLGKPLLKEDRFHQDEEESILKMADAVMNKPFMVEALIQKIKTLALTVVEKSQ